jgi:hypothetical protein
LACILRYFNNAEGDAGIPWSKAAQFAVQPLSLLGLIGLGNDGVYITDPGKEFLAIPPVKEKFNNEFEKHLCPEDTLAVCGTPKSSLCFACPSLTIHIKVDQLKVLQDGTIPPEADLSGEGACRRYSVYLCQPHIANGRTL